MDDGSEEGDYRRAAWVGLRPDSEHSGCDIFTRRIRDIYSSRLHGKWKVRTMDEDGASARGVGSSSASRMVGTRPRRGR